MSRPPCICTCNKARQRPIHEQCVLSYGVNPTTAVFCKTNAYNPSICMLHARFVRNEFAQLQPCRGEQHRNLLTNVLIATKKTKFTVGRATNPMAAPKNTFTWRSVLGIWVALGTDRSQPKPAPASTPISAVYECGQTRKHALTNNETHKHPYRPSSLPCPLALPGGSWPRRQAPRRRAPNESSHSQMQSR